MTTGRPFGSRTTTENAARGARPSSSVSTATSSAIGSSAIGRATTPTAEVYGRRRRAGQGAVVVVVGDGAGITENACSPGYT